MNSTVFLLQHHLLSHSQIVKLLFIVLLLKYFYMTLLFVLILFIIDTSDYAIVINLPVTCRNFDLHPLSLSRQKLLTLIILRLF